MLSICGGVFPEFDLLSEHKGIRDVVESGVEVGGYRLGIRSFPLWSSRPSGSMFFGFGPMRGVRADLETFCGRRRGSVWFTGVTPIPVMVSDRDVWMSLTPMEFLSMRGGIRIAKGHTLVGGLGLGYLVRRIARKKSVKKVTVVERESALIEFFGPNLKEEFGDSIELIEGDVYDFIDVDYDRVVLDIWKSSGGASYDRKLEPWREKYGRYNLWTWGINY